MSLPLANTVQMGIRGDSIPPVISSSGVDGYAPLDKITLVSGLTATDNELGNITSYISPIGDFYSGFIGSFEHDFVVRDRWGNTATATATINVEGAYYLQETPYYDDFSQGLGEHWIKENGDFDTVSGSLVAIGTQPASPRWNALIEADSNAHVQAVFNLNGVTQVGGPIIRYVDSNNFYYANFNIGDGLKLVKRAGGAYIDVITTDIEVPPDEDFTVGIKAYVDKLTLIYNGQVVGEATDRDNLYGNKHGVLLNTTSHEIKSYWIAASDININLLSEGVMFPNGNQQPTANAGPDQSVAAGARVQLNASMSSDPEDGAISQFGWEQIENGADSVVLEFANTAMPEFTAPSSLTPQTLEFRVQAQDSEGLTSTDTVRVNVAALEENEILNTMETLDFELVTQGNLVAYKGRSNREVMQLKPSSLTGIVTAGGYLDLSQNGIVKIEIIADGKKISNEDSDSIKIDGTRILARLGDLDIPTGGRDSATPTFMIVLYVSSDTRGLVVASNVSAGYKPLSYRVEEVA